MLVQLYSILFAVALAYSNKVPCEKFRWTGTSIKEDKIFHRANLIVKVLFALIISNGIVLPFILCGLWLWLVFDIALNVFIGNTWFYTGDTAKSDRLLKRYLGEYAGLVKMLVVSSAILTINFFL
jgi:hypothetical protein